MGLLALNYFYWHYTRALSDFFRVWGNFFWFFWYFFSIGLLLGTLFSPLQRLDEQYKKGLYPEQWFETFVVNSLMRLTGAVVRLVLIAIGIVALLATAVFGVGFFIAWLLVPVLVAATFIGGIALTFS